MMNYELKMRFEFHDSAFGRLQRQAVGSFVIFEDDGLCLERPVTLPAFFVS